MGWDWGWEGGECLEEGGWREDWEEGWGEWEGGLGVGWGEEGGIRFRVGMVWGLLMLV